MNILYHGIDLTISETDEICCFAKNQVETNRRCQYVFQTIYAKNLRLSCNGIRGGRIHSLCHASDYHSCHRRTSPRHIMLVFLLPLIFELWSDLYENCCTYCAQVHAENTSRNFQNMMHHKARRKLRCSASRLFQIHIV